MSLPPGRFRRVSKTINIEQAPVGLRSRKPAGVPIVSKRLCKTKQIDWQASVDERAAAAYKSECYRLAFCRLYTP